MTQTLEGRTALVTGASSGIGRACALALAAAGARVIGAARRTALIDALNEAVVPGGGRISALSFDMAVAGEAEALARRAVSEGTVDILVNAGGGSRPVSLDTGGPVWEDAMRVGFFAPRELTHALLPGMRDRGWGRVVTVTGTSEPQFLSAATPAKAALHAWSKGLSLAVARDGITVNCIQPGRIRSEQVMRRLRSAEEERGYADTLPMGRLGEAEDVASAALFLASNQASYISGVVLPVDGSFRRFAF